MPLRALTNGRIRPDAERTEALGTEVPPIDPSSPPEFLSDGERDVFSRVATLLTITHVATALDRHLIAAYAIAVCRVAELRNANDDAARRGWVNSLRLIGSELGLSPASRLRFASPSPPVADTLSPLERLERDSLMLHRKRAR